MKPLKQTQLDSLLALLQESKEYVFLDTARSSPENACSYLFTDAINRIDFFAGDDLPKYLATMEGHLGSGKYLAGWLSYEMGYLLEPQLAGYLPQVEAGRPLASLGVFSEPKMFTHLDGTTDFPFKEGAKSLPEYNLHNLQLSQSKEDYLTAIAKIKEYIAAGDTYQVNYTLKLLFDFDGSPEALYRTLRRNQSVAYGSLLRLGEDHILSLSPELFFKTDSDSILVRPMKGTMHRGRDLQEDQELCDLLRNDGKNRSENVMIVDLLRNDLARLSHQYGGGQVETLSLFDVERYESVLQMTSTISARMDANVLAQVGMAGFLKALFPCGSVTGAPKIRTMEIIRELETAARGVYTGAIGYFAPDGAATFNVPIRTIRISKNRGEMGIGSGIVHDSEAEQEWQECLLKGHFLTRATAEFVLIETLLLGPDGGYFLLEEHLQRLQHSADYFSFHYSREETLTALAKQKAGCEEQKTCLRVRLTLAKDGSLHISSCPCELPLATDLPEQPSLVAEDLPRIAFSRETVDSSSPWFFHKSSNRDLFQREFSRATEESLYDIVFINEHGEVTEGCIHNLIVLLDGSYYTPPLSSGLLAGTMRGRLLANISHGLTEKVLRPEDFHRAEAIYCCNSVRGVVRVCF
jgi:para-aminobenzoate synthetase/4-amino-4-deoxychorismate lyase